MRAQHRQIVAVTAHHVRLVLDPRGEILLIQQFPLGNHGVGQFDGGLVQQHDVHAVNLQSTGCFVGQPGLDSLPIDGWIEQHAQVNVTHRTGGTRNL